MLPCNHQIWSCWAPLAERTTLVTIAIAGMNVGTVITMPLTGLLTKYGFDGGWASVFYCFGKTALDSPIAKETFLNRSWAFFLVQV